MADYTRNDVKAAKAAILAAVPDAVVEDWQDFGFRLAVVDRARNMAYIVYQPEREDIGQEGIISTPEKAIAWLKESADG